MEKIKIITDSTCDLPKDIVEEFDIEVIPLSVNINCNSYKDGVDITFDKLDRTIVETEDFPTTSPVNPDVFKEVYESYLNKGYKIISIHISNKLSATYQSACIARNILDTKDIFIYDSLNVGAGLGMLAYECADMVKSGCSVDEICSFLERSIPNIKSRVIIDSLYNLVRAGRIGRTVGLIGDFLRIKPVLSAIGGELILVDKFKKTKTILEYLIRFINDNDIDQETKIWIVYSKGSVLVNDVKGYLDSKGYKYFAVHVGCVVGAYTGNKCIGIFIRKD